MMKNKNALIRHLIQENSIAGCCYVKGWRGWTDWLNKPVTANDRSGYGFHDNRKAYTAISKMEATAKLAHAEEIGNDRRKKTLAAWIGFPWVDYVACGAWWTFSIYFIVSLKKISKFSYFFDRLLWCYPLNFFVLLILFC